MTDILRVDLTREKATIIHGIVQLYLAEHHNPCDPRLVAVVARDIPKWKKQAILTETLVIDQNFGALMRGLATFIDGVPPQLGVER